MNLIEFNDGIEIEEKTRWLEDYAEKKDYESLNKQSEADPHHDWGDNMNVLFVSDRTPGRTYGLMEYLKAKTNIANVIHCSTLADAKVFIKCCKIDILIFIGYQKDKTNYEIKKILKEQNPKVYTVMYAFLDIMIKNECMENYIQHAFSSKKPALDFIGYLKESYSIHNLLLETDINYDSPPKRQSFVSDPVLKNHFVIGVFNKVKDAFLKRTSKMNIKLSDESQKH